MLNIYTVHDQASQTYIKPFMLITDRDAIEGFKYVCNDEETPYAKHPADYNLCNIGTFDEQTGILKPASPKVIARAINLKAKPLTSKDIQEQINKLKIELEEME